jgi:hypothetical protein
MTSSGSPSTTPSTKHHLLYGARRPFRDRGLHGHGHRHEPERARGLHLQGDPVHALGAAALRPVFHLYLADEPQVRSVQPRSRQPGPTFYQLAGRPRVGEVLHRDTRADGSGGDGPDLPRRLEGDTAGPLRCRQDRRRRRPKTVLQHNTSAYDPGDPLRRHPGDNPGTAGIHPVLHHDRGRAEPVHPVLRLLSLRERLQLQPDGIRLGHGLDIVRRHPDPLHRNLPLVEELGPLRVEPGGSAW